MRIATITSCAKDCGRRATRRGLCHNHYEQHRSRMKAYGRWQSSFIDAEPARQHIAALRATGMGFRRIAELSGASRNNVAWIARGRPERGYRTIGRVKATTAQAILAIPVPEHPGLLAAGALVDPTGTTRRLQALVAIGYTQMILAEHLGIAPSNATRLFKGTSQVTAATMLRVERLFNELHMTPGPSQRARNHARRQRWAPPLAWDEESIDDPAATPDLGHPGRASFPERYLEMQYLGYAEHEIADRLGVKANSLLRQVQRHGLPVSRKLTELAHRERYQS